MILRESRPSQEVDSGQLPRVTEIKSVRVYIHKRMEHISSLNLRRVDIEIKAVFGAREKLRVTEEVPLKTRRAVSRRVQNSRPSRRRNWRLKRLRKINYPSTLCLKISIKLCIIILTENLRFLRGGLAYGIPRYSWKFRPFSAWETTPRIRPRPVDNTGPLKAASAVSKTL